jgi:hypothetical protein
MRRFACLLGMLALLVCLAAPVLAQETRGSIEGIVKDTSGAVLPGVTVEARSPNLVGVATVTSDLNGIYRFPALAPGIYEVTATLNGFQTKKVTEVQLQIGQILKIDFPLQVAGVSESVSVSAESPLIDVKQNAAAATITSEIIDRIPKGRDWTSVVTTAPGVNEESRAGGFQIDGSSGSENRFIVDGMDRTNIRTGTSNAQNSNATVLTDFLQEVQVKSSGYSAEYGGSTGGVISAITKSGSNQFRGDFGTYYRNDNFQSAPRKGWRINPFTDCAAVSCSGTPEFVATPDTQFDNWNPFGDVGGPVFHDKMWFFFGASYNRTDNERTTTFRNSVPTAEQRPGAPYVTKTMTSWSESSYYNWNGTARLNSNMNLRVSGANTRSGNRGSIANNLQPDGSFFADGTPTDGFTTATWDTDPEKYKDRWERTGGNGRNDLYSANLDWVLTPKLFTNVQAGYYVYDNNTPAEFAGTAIVHSFAQNLVCNGTPGSATCPFPEVPAHLLQNSGYVDNKSTNRTLTDFYSRTFFNINTSWFKSWKGEHNFKFGARFEHVKNDARSGNQQPTISLQWNRALTTSDGRTMRGRYGYYTVTRGLISEGEATSNNWSLWLQDSWTLHSKLTVNAGVRAEKEVVPSYEPENPGIEFGFGDKIAPRVGFAYDIKGDSRWKAYGSYGAYFDITKLELPRGAFGGDKWKIYSYTLDTFDWPSIQCQEGTNTCPGTFIQIVDNRHLANAVDPALTAYFGREQNTIDPDLKPVQTGELTLGLDHELGKGMSVGVRYTHKWLDRTIEDSGINLPAVGEVFFIANPGFGVANQILPSPAPPMPKAQRDYDGVELRLMKRLANRWSLNTSYLWSRLYGNYGGLASSDENGRTSPNVDRYFDGLYLLFDADGNAVLGRLPTDRPHYWKAQVTYDTPWKTLVGVNTQVMSGTPVSTTINLLGYSPNFINGRGDLGRTPVTSQVDLFLQHDFRLFGSQKVNVNLNVDNLFDQDGITSYTSTPYRDTLNGVPGLSGTGTAGQLSARDAYLLGGYDPVALVTSLRSAGTAIRDNSLFGKPSGFQGRRQLRLGLKFSF